MGSSQPKPKPLSPFEFMDKYRVPILLLCLLGLVGFGAWGALVSYLGIGRDEERDPSKVVATYELEGETHEVTQGEFSAAPFRRNLRDSKDVYADRLAQIIRRRMVDVYDVRVTPDELKSAIDQQFVEALKTQNDGKFDPTQYRRLANAWGMTVSEFESAFAESLRMAKLMREYDRPVGDLPMEEVYAKYKLMASKLKLEGIFFSSESFEKKLERDADGNLTPEARAELERWWKEDLTADDRKAFHTGGAIMTAEYATFRFKDRSDEELVVEFNKPDRTGGTTGKSLADLTADFEPTDADYDKMRLRLERYASDYGVEGTDDLEAAFETKKERLVIEWKIWKLVKALHDRIMVDQVFNRTAPEDQKRPIDLEEIAKSNDLDHGTLRDISYVELRDHEEVGGTWAGQFQGVPVGEVLNWTAALGPTTPWYGTGPVDEPAKHVGIWKMLEKEMRPEPQLDDVLDAAIERYETKEAEKLRDEAFTAFEKLMDEKLDGKVKDFAEKARAEAEEAIAEETKDLDPEKDKEKIEEIRQQQMQLADAKIEDEKSKYRGEVFRELCENPPENAIVVIEGYFLPMLVAQDQGPEKDEKGVAEKKARLVLRKEFRELHDQAFTDTAIEVGTVTQPKTSAFYPSLKGIAMLLDKKVPTVEDMLWDPRVMNQAEMQARAQRRRDNPIPPDAEDPVWGWTALKTGPFKVRAEVLDERLAEEAERKAEVERRREKWREAKERRDAAANPPPSPPIEALVPPELRRPTWIVPPDAFTPRPDENDDD